MKYLSIKNFQKHQHYKDRRPSWIKLYAEILDDYEFVCLQDASRSHLMLLWILASKLDNRIPYDVDFIAKALKSTTPLDIETLIAQGFVQVSEDASTLLAERKQSAMPETETEKKLLGRVIGVHPLNTYSPEFLETRKAYPKRAGGDSEADAWKQYQARLRSGETHEAIHAGTLRYAAYIRATGKEKTEYVKQMCTFLGKSRHYLEAWDVPATASTNGKRPGETQQEYNDRKRGYVRLDGL